MTTIKVSGTPAPQGSQRAFVHRHTGRAVVVESSAKVRPWRAAITAACKAERVPHHEGPVTVSVIFYMPRPRSHHRADGVTLRPTAPVSPSVRPDLDKLLRSTLDGLTDAGVIEDDARIVSISARKIYAVPPEPPGALITIFKETT